MNVEQKLIEVLERKKVELSVSRQMYIKSVMRSATRKELKELISQMEAQINILEFILQESKS